MQNKNSQYENRPGKCLVNLLTAKGEKTKHPSMISKEGKELKLEIDSKVKEFESFYKTLYQTTNPSKDEMTQFLEGLDKKKRKDSQLILMEELIRQEEIKLAITRIKNNTAPGVDGFTIEFSKAFLVELSPSLEHLYNYNLQIKMCPCNMG